MIIIESLIINLKLLKPVILIWHHNSKFDYYFAVIIIRFTDILSLSVLLRLFSLYKKSDSYLMMTIVNNVTVSYSSYSLLIYSASDSYLSYFSSTHSTSWAVNLAKSSTDSSINFSTIVLSQDLLYLSDCCVLTVYQFKQFELMNHVYAFLILNDVVDLVHSIIILYFIFTDYQSSADTSDL